jgi:hypothetical protein
MNKIEFTYKKDDSRKLFKSLEENQEFGILEPQNYIPLYNSYFSLTKANYNSIILNQNWKMHEILGQEPDSNNIFTCVVKNEEGAKKEQKVFLKFSPLLDPIKYLLGKYDTTNTSLLNLPSFESASCNPKVEDYNNSAYVDSFFTYLSSKLLHDHGFVHGMDFYGSFLAMKTDFRINVIDDIDYLNDSNFFKKNDKIMYELEMDDGMNSDTRNYKKKLVFSALNDGDVDKTILQLSDISDLKELDAFVSEKNGEDLLEIDPELITVELNGLEKTQTKSTHSSCSSRTSNTSGEPDNESCNASESGTDDEDAERKSDDEEWESDSSHSSHDSYDEDDLLIAKIKKFPVQVIALEHCKTTLDEYMTSGKITPEIWDSIVLQILFSLITFQNVFGLTHNDLHTNNVMYVETDKKFLYYKLNHIYYKVPTFGKLFKIIDYGRAIYKFRGHTLCSDSYHPEGDAATQYNCEPYFNDKKPRLEPNFGFDLCRLGCALYDYLVDEPKTKIVQIMLDWVKDDKGRNILYKKNGDERYPDFKLYKMIARTANKHVPVNVLGNSYFDKFIATKKEVVKQIYMDLDAIPSYM